MLLHISTSLLLHLLILLTNGDEEIAHVFKRKAKNKNESKEECSKRPLQFSYGDSPTGPDNWPAMYETCAGSNQSPINIDMSDLENLKVSPLQWSSAYFNTPKSMTLTSNNHTVTVKGVYPEDCQPKISGGPIKKPYFFSGIHFHWGSRDSKGSEHTVDEFAYPMEMHVVHTKGTQQEESPDILVVAYFFQISENENTAINNILDVFLKAIKRPFEPVKLKKPFSLASLVQPFSSEYVTYKGSLTVPPCTEGVKWVVYPYPLDISKKQMDKFRMACKYAPGMNNNYRPVQSLNDRKVYFVT